MRRRLCALFLAPLLAIAALAAPLAPAIAGTDQVQGYPTTCPATGTPPAGVTGFVYVAVDAHGNVCFGASNDQGASGSAAPSLTDQVGGSDGTNLHTLLTDSLGRLIASPAGKTQTASLASSQVIKASPGTLYSWEVAADSTLASAEWWVMIFDATSAPADGAVTPAKCYAVSPGQPGAGATYGAGGVTFATGIVIVASSTGCFTKTASAHAYAAGDFQ